MELQDTKSSQTFHSFAKQLKTQGYDAYNPNSKNADKRIKQCVGTTIDGREINIWSKEKLCKSQKHFFLQRHEQYNTVIKMRHRLRLKLQDKNQSKPQDEDVPGVPQNKRV